MLKVIKLYKLYSVIAIITMCVAFVGLFTYNLPEFSLIFFSSIVLGCIFVLISYKLIFISEEEELRKVQELKVKQEEIDKKEFGGKKMEIEEVEKQKKCENCRHAVIRYVGSRNSDGLCMHFVCSHPLINTVISRYPSDVRCKEHEWGSPSEEFTKKVESIF